MKNTLRIAFMGTPEFAVASLEALLEKGFPVVVVVTAPDRPAGRGRKLQASPVKECALKYGLPVLQPERLKGPEFLEQLRSFQVNLQIVVAFRMLPEVVWSMPAYGTFNLHASLLPDYRGAAPIHCAVINGERKTGVTTFFIDAEIDTGKIILQESVPIRPDETTGQLYETLMAKGASLVLETVRKIGAGPVETTVQKHLETSKKAPKLTPENTRIDWLDTTGRIYDTIRGLCPFPGAWTHFENDGAAERVKLYGSRRAERREEADPGSTLQEGNKLFARTGDGWLEITEMQLPGKRRMFVEDILNGLKIEKNARFL